MGSRHRFMGELVVAAMPRRAAVALGAGVAALAAVLLPGPAEAAITRTQPAADAYVTASKRTANFGRARTLLADAAPATRSYIRFNVSGVAGSIRNVTLELSAQTGSTAGLSVRRATAKGWGERTIKFANAPGMTGPAVSSGPVRLGRVKIDVSSLVTGNGLVTLVLTTRRTVTIKLASREAPAASRPALVVTSNSSPTCAPTSLTTDEDGAGTTAASCSDPDGDALVYSIAAQGSKGTASAAGGTLAYAPNPNANGADSFSYQARDASGASASATVSVTVRPVNDAPTCNPVTLTTDEDATGSTDPACTDADGDALTYEIASQGTKGAASITGGTRLRFVPNANAHGSDGFTYRARDVGGLASAATTASVTIRPVNDAPSCEDRTLTTNEDTAASVASACTDVEGDPLTHSIVVQGAKGSAAAIGGNLSYAPHANANGSDSFAYRASDGSAPSPAASVNVTITPVNDLPTCEPRALTTNEDETGFVTPNCADVEGDALTYEIAPSPAPTKGSASVVESNLRYSPNLNSNGSDSFAYRAKDAGGAGVPATVSVTVTAVNDRPSAVFDVRSVPEDGTLTFPAAELTANDAPGPANESAQTLTVTGVSAGPNTHGSVSLAAGQITYSPAAGYSGPASFTYTVCDNGTPSSCDSGTVAVSVGAVNDLPSCASRNLTTNEDTAGTVAPLCTDPDGDSLTYEIVDQGTKGFASVVAGELRYLPNADANGSDSFTYRARDASGAGAPATVSVTITAVNDLPRCLDRTLTTDEETPNSVGAACSDAENDPLTYEIVGQGTKGTASVATAQLSYDPNANANGSDSFTYRANDGTAPGAAATVAVTILAVNDVPEAVPLDLTTSEDTAKVITLLAEDGDGDSLTFRIDTLAASGALYDGTGTSGHLIQSSELPYTLSGDRVTYAPLSGFAGPDSFQFRASDGSTSSDLTDVAITVRAVNRAPVCTSSSSNVEEDGDLAGTACSDDDGDELTFTGSDPNNGTVELFDDGGFSYVPDPDYNGPDSFTVTATDPDGLSSGSATITLTVTPVNDEPVCEDVEIPTEQDVAGETPPSCFDVDSDLLTYAIVDQGTLGTASVTAGNDLRYVPNSGATGSDAFTYKASDGELDSLPANAAVQIAPANSRPTCADVAILTSEDDNGTASPDCLDADDDPLTFEIVGQGTLGTASVSDGELLYVPNPDVSGTDSFTYRADDGELLSLAATVQVTIDPVNDPPTANLDEFATVLDGASVDIDFRKNDTKGPANESSQTLRATAVTDPATGEATIIEAGGKIRYTPEEGARGDAFEYTVCDNGTPNACATGTISVMVVGGVLPTVETEPVLHSGDAADDPAIWVHPTDPSLSTVIGTDKLGGIAVYDLAGVRIQSLDPTRRMNNVDLRDDFALPGQPEPVTLVVASDRTGGSWRLNLYRVDVATRTLVSVRTVPMTFEPYGLCLYRSATTGTLYVFANEEDSAVGRMEQWELEPDATAPGGVKATQRRTWNVGSEAEGCVADDDLGHLYVAEEDVGIWKYGAEPGAGTTRTSVDTVDYGSGHLRKDAEGLAIVYGPTGTGYLLASSQGNNSFAVYRREAGNAWLGNVRLDQNFDVDPVVDGVTDTDGIDVTSMALGPSFGDGLFVAHDGTNTLWPSGSANQNFKFVPLERVLAGIPLPF